MNIDNFTKVTGGLSLIFIGTGALKHNLSRNSVDVNRSCCSMININLGLGTTVLTGALVTTSGLISLYQK